MGRCSFVCCVLCVVFCVVCCVLCCVVLCVVIYLTTHRPKCRQLATLHFPLRRRRLGYEPGTVINHQSSIIQSNSQALGLLFVVVGIVGEEELGISSVQSKREKRTKKTSSFYIFIFCLRVGRKMSIKHTATEPTERVDIKIAPRGFGALTPRTVIDVFRDTVQKHGTRPALCYKLPVNVR